MALYGASCILRDRVPKRVIGRQIDDRTRKLLWIAFWEENARSFMGDHLAISTCIGRNCRNAGAKRMDQS